MYIMKHKGALALILGERHVFFLSLRKSSECH